MCLQLVLRPFRAHRSPLWTLNTLVKYISYVHTFCVEGGHLYVFMSQLFAQVHMRNALVWEAVRLASSSADPIYRRTLVWDSPISRNTTCERLSFHSGNYGSSSTGVHTIHGRSAFASAAGFTLPVSRRNWSSIRNTLASGRRRQG